MSRKKKSSVDVHGRKVPRNVMAKELKKMHSFYSADGKAKGWTRATINRAARNTARVSAAYQMDMKKWAGQKGATSKSLDRLYGKNTKAREAARKRRGF